MQLTPDDQWCHGHLDLSQKGWAEALVNPT